MINAFLFSAYEQKYAMPTFKDYVGKMKKDQRIVKLDTLKRVNYFQEAITNLYHVKVVEDQVNELQPFVEIGTQRKKQRRKLCDLPSRPRWTLLMQGSYKGQIFEHKTGEKGLTISIDMVDDDGIKRKMSVLKYLKGHGSWFGLLNVHNTIDDSIPSTKASAVTLDTLLKYAPVVHYQGIHRKRVVEMVLSPYLYKCHYNVAVRFSKALQDTNETSVLKMLEEWMPSIDIDKMTREGLFSGMVKEIFPDFGETVQDEDEEFAAKVSIPSKLATVYSIV